MTRSILVLETHIMLPATVVKTVFTAPRLLMIPNTQAEFEDGTPWMHCVVPLEERRSHRAASIKTIQRPLESYDRCTNCRAGKFVP